MAIDLIGLRRFKSCPEFGFEPCRWRFVPKGNGDDPFDRFTMWAHQWFDAHQQHFSPAIEELLAAHAAIVPFGMSFLPIETAAAVASNAATAPLTSIKASAASPTALPYDLAISFAGPNRDMAERIAVRVRDAGLAVFYDDFFPEALWGKDLAVFFDNVFRKESRFCLILISKAYLERPWTEHERRSAITRMVTERGDEYVLPVQVDVVELPGLAPTIGYLSAERYSPEQIADLLIAKLRKSA